MILASLGKDTATNADEGLLDLYKKIRPGEPLYVDNARSLLESMFFDARRYDLAKVGRYKFNKKLHLKNRIVGHVLAEDVINEETGEILGEAGDDRYRGRHGNGYSGCRYSFPVDPGGRGDHKIKVLSNRMVDMSRYVSFDPMSVGIHESVFYPALAALMEEFPNEEEMAVAVPKRLADLVPKHITKEDIFASINYCIHLSYGLGSKDDIDHLGNRRVRCSRRAAPEPVPHRSCPVWSVWYASE